ncbi:MAG TPA: SRPBCC domain-containing protein [Rhizomicrobium sp.]|nr:SRPBCC domain-containing protein [Rhizomicrobium sp.]
MLSAAAKFFHHTRTFDPHTTNIFMPMHDLLPLFAPPAGCKIRVMTATRIRCHINAPRAAVYRALLDPIAVAAWRVPDGMTSQIHTFEAREGGRVRVSLTYEDPNLAGKTAARTDTYHGRFIRLVPNEQVVEVDEFETADPALRGEMTSTITLSDSGSGTNVEAIHDGLPAGVAPADNELGWRLALAKLAKLLETGPAPSLC